MRLPKKEVNKKRCLITGFIIRLTYTTAIHKFFLLILFFIALSSSSICQESNLVRIDTIRTDPSGLGYFWEYYRVVVPELKHPQCNFSLSLMFEQSVSTRFITLSIVPSRSWFVGSGLIIIEYDNNARDTLHNDFSYNLNGETYHVNFDGSGNWFLWPMANWRPKIPFSNLTRVWRRIIIEDSPINIDFPLTNQQSKYIKQAMDLAITFVKAN